ncbi:ribosome hibernation promotion factor [Allokutzneria albata]|uniref:Sigma 54 modulation protein / S30EA ribosomal protein n=1 Tax=Allokutzneria albata TaxID=211114 RepID=A0A1G9SJK4_ALLAB|nr:HPF/RaiA family ribosome-associated protein [Allokutzneria albata]SDM35674.1 Sigma 54 modulation protein / S30EA ribosomal protein [Allokutzneria albata]
MRTVAHSALPEAELSTAGAVPLGADEYARKRLAGLARVAPAPVDRVRVRLSRATGSGDRSAVVKAALHISGRVIRAHVAAPTFREAVDRMRDVLHHRLSVLGSLRTDPPRRRAEHRPVRVHRAPADRDLVRRKTYAPEPMSITDARTDMGLLDHDFYLFVDRETGRDTVITHDDHAVLDAAVAPVLPLVHAIERLDLSNEPFVFFVDVDTGRGSLVYLRYDGHYGLISPH